VSLCGHTVLVYIRLFSLLNRTLDSFGDLHYRNDGKSKYDSNCILEERDVSESECIAEERNVDNRGSEYKRGQHRHPQPFIMVRHTEY